MGKVEEMLLSNKVKINKDKSMKSPTERVCLCGVVVKYEDLTPSGKKYKKFRCPTCEAGRKMKYRKPKKGVVVEVEEVVPEVKETGKN